MSNFFECFSDTQTLTALLGVSTTGFVFILFRLRTAVKEMAEAINQIKTFFEKYGSFFTSGAGKEDFEKTKKEVDDALEAVADILEKTFFKKHAQKLRDIIKR